MSDLPLSCGRIERAPWQLRVGDWWLDVDELRTYVMPPPTYGALAALDPPADKTELDYLLTMFGHVSMSWKRELRLLLLRGERYGEIIQPDRWWELHVGLLKEPKVITLHGGGHAYAYAEFNGGHSHVIADDGCWVIVNDGRWATHLFPGAMSVLRLLPDCPYDYEPCRRVMGMTQEST